MKNRDKLEIIRDIIETCKMPDKKKTHIMYNCNLSYQQLDEYLNGICMRNGLIEQYDIIENYGKGRQRIIGIGYRATDKGREWINDFSKILARVVSQ